MNNLDLAISLSTHLTESKFYNKWADAWLAGNKEYSMFVENHIRGVDKDLYWYVFSSLFDAIQYYNHDEYMVAETIVVSTVMPALLRICRPETPQEQLAFIRYKLETS